MGGGLLMDIVTIDFETYYDQNYSLSKITTEEYIRSTLFEVIGVGIKIGDGPTKTYTDYLQIVSLFKSMDFSDKAILCHNTAFDGAILSWRFGVRPRLWLDTLSMARPEFKVTVGGSLSALVSYFDLGEKGTEVIQAKGKRQSDFTPQELAAYMKYCANDVELTYQLFKRLKKNFPVQEIMVIDQTIRMYTDPKIVLDRSLLKIHLKKVQERKQELMDALNLNGTDEENRSLLMSNAQFAKLLEAEGVNPPMKTSPRTGKYTYAFAKTDPGMLALLEHPSERVQTLAAARVGVKSTLEETRTEALIRVADRGTLPILLNYYGAHTGRFSGGDKLNLQNFPSRQDNTLRRCLRAPKGYVLAAVDSSQIEARMAAYIAGQEDLLESFRAGRDVYSEFASDAYGRTITKADKQERFVGKTCILGLQYGVGAPKLRQTLALGQGGMKVFIDESQAKDLVYLYRRKYFKIPALWNTCQMALYKMIRGDSGQIHTNLLAYDGDGMEFPNGLRFKYPGLQEAPDGEVVYISNARDYRKYVKSRFTRVDESSKIKLYGAKVVENITQALARIVITEQMTRIGQQYQVLFQVHDEIICLVPEAEADHALAWMIKEMSVPPKWAPDLPVACEGGYAKNYGEIEK
jgi:DNA polymerase I-like protein with 3'-5' exonuclease and polymerase domains